MLAPQDPGWQLEEPEVARLMGLWGLIDLVASIGQWGRSGRHRPSSAERALSERRARCAVLLSLLSRVEHTFRDPGTGANLIEALDRFRVAYPT